MSSSANGKEGGEAMTVDADCGSAWAVVESMTLEASQDSDVGAPALAMADSRVRCAAVSMRPVCCRCASAAVSESPHGRATRPPLLMARMTAAESWVTSSGVLLLDDAVALADGDDEADEPEGGEEAEDDVDDDGSAEAEGADADAVGDADVDDSAP